jgi:DNA-binding HxlR family transcriptional regulator
MQSVKDVAWRGMEDMGILHAAQKLFEPHRILIMKILLYFGETDFQELKNLLKLTDGNLVSHLRALEDEEFIESRKVVTGKKVKTVYTLTKSGKDAFEYFMQRMKVVFLENA